MRKHELRLFSFGAVSEYDFSMIKGNFSPCQGMAEVTVNGAGHVTMNPW